VRDKERSIMEFVRNDAFSLGGFNHSTIE
jgi:hypothetical protein